MSSVRGQKTSASTLHEKTMIPQGFNRAVPSLCKPGSPPHCKDLQLDDAWCSQRSAGSTRCRPLFNPRFRTARDKQQTDKKVLELRKRQFAEIRSLSREVQEYRHLLDAARQGDRQRLRNTLRRHRPTQLAFEEHTVDVSQQTI